MQELGTLGLRPFACLANDAVTGCLGLAEDFGLTGTGFAQEALALFADAGKALVGFVGLLERLVDKLLALLNHLRDDGKTELRHQEEHDEEGKKHPKEQSQIGSEYGWQID